MNKSEIIQSIIAQQETLVHELKTSLENYRSSADIDHDDTIDPEDLSHSDEAKEFVVHAKSQLQRAEIELARIHNYALKDHEQVEVGALVETENRYFFIGVSTLPFSVNDKEVMGVSTDSPAFLAMRNKKTGESFSVAGRKYQIISVA